MRRIRVKRQQPKPLEQRYLEVKEELKNLCKESWNLRTASIELQRMYDDTREENVTLKEQRQEYRNEGIEQRVLKERAEKARDTVTRCYDALLWQVAEISEPWYDRHLNETGNILGKEPFDPTWEDDLEAKQLT